MKISRVDVPRAARNPLPLVGLILLLTADGLAQPADFHCEDLDGNPCFDYPAGSQLLVSQPAMDLKLCFAMPDSDQCVATFEDRFDDICHDIWYQTYSGSCDGKNTPFDPGAWNTAYILYFGPESDDRTSGAIHSTLQTATNAHVLTWACAYASGGRTYIGSGQQYCYSEHVEENAGSVARLAVVFSENGPGHGLGGFYGGAVNLG